MLQAGYLLHTQRSKSSMQIIVTQTVAQLRPSSFILPSETKKRKGDSSKTCACSQGGAVRRPLGSDLGRVRRNDARARRLLSPCNNLSATVQQASLYYFRAGSTLLSPFFCLPSDVATRRAQTHRRRTPVNTFI